MTERSKTLVVGAAGKFASLVVPTLASRGTTIRGLVTSEEQAAAARADGAHEVAIGNLCD